VHKGPQNGQSPRPAPLDEKLVQKAVTSAEPEIGQGDKVAHKRAEQNEQGVDEYFKIRIEQQVFAAGVENQRGAKVPESGGRGQRLFAQRRSGAHFLLIYFCYSVETGHTGVIKILIVNTDMYLRYKLPIHTYFTSCICKKFKGMRLPCPGLAKTHFLKFWFLGFWVFAGFFWVFLGFCWVFLGFCWVFDGFLLCFL